MQITCPNCNHSKQVDRESLPPKTTRATCPKCGESFSLSVSPEVQATASSEVASGAGLSQQESTSPRQLEIDTFPKAGFWLRVVATILDSTIVAILQTMLSIAFVFAGKVAIGGGEEQLVFLAPLVLLLGLTINLAYFVTFTGHCGQTPGKMALRIKVIRTDGSDIGYGKAAFREIVAKFISGIILCIGYLMVAFDEQKQGLHDRMADTYVIKL